MGDITDLFSTVSRTKVTPVKGYNASQNTTSTTYVDVTGAQISVANNQYYSMKIIISALSPSTTCTYQILLGASVIKNGTVISGGGGSASLNVDLGILQNTSGSTQTLKVQIHSDNGANTVGITNGSCAAGTIILPFDASGYAIMDIWADISSLSFTGILSNVYYDGIPNLDASANVSTWNTGTDKVSQIIRFWGSTSGYVAFDFTGKQLVV